MHGYAASRVSFKQGEIAAFSENVRREVFGDLFARGHRIVEQSQDVYEQKSLVMDLNCYGISVAYSTARPIESI